MSVKKKPAPVPLSPAENRRRIRRLSQLAMLFALALVLSWVESFLPPPPLPVPGVKYGLSNIPIMFCLLTWGGAPAFLLALLKSAFIVLMQGLLAGSISLAGGLLSVLVMSGLLLIFRQKLSYFLLSIGGAIAHNIGQLFLVSILYGFSLISFLPLLLLSGLLAGTLTALLLRAALPLLNKGIKDNNSKKIGRTL